MNHAELARQVRQRFRSIHAFCRAHPELKRATVYLALSGRYPGDTRRQLRKIETALDGVEPRRTISAARIAEAVQENKCAHCRRLDRRFCGECRNQTMLDARVVEKLLEAELCQNNS